MSDWKKRRRVKTVTAHDPETGRIFYLKPEDEIPDWFPKPTNPKVFADEAPQDTSAQEQEYEKLSARKLLSLAKERGIEVFSNKKADIITALTLADEDADNSR